MTDETLHEFLDRRERELRHQIAALHGQLAPKMKELDDLIRTKGSLGIPVHGIVGDKVALEGRVTIAGVGSAAGSVSGVGSGSGVGSIRLDMPDIRTDAEKRTAPYKDMTIKELVIEALRITTAATAAQLREFIRDAFGHTVNPSSLRPQLSRLKAEGLIQQDASTDTWTLAKMPDWPGIERIIGSGRPAALSDDDAFLEKARRLAWTPEDDAFSRQLEQDRLSGKITEEEEAAAIQENIAAKGPSGINRSI